MRDDHQTLHQFPGRASVSLPKLQLRTKLDSAWHNDDITAVIGTPNGHCGYFVAGARNGRYGYTFMS